MFKEEVLQGTAAVQLRERKQNVVEITQEKLQAFSLLVFSCFSPWGIWTYGMLHGVGCSISKVSRKVF